MSAKGQQPTFQDNGHDVRLSVVAVRWPDLWCADGLRQTVEDHDALTAAVGRGRFISVREALVDVLPVVDRPDVSCRIEGNVGFDPWSNHPWASTQAGSSRYLEPIRPRSVSR